MIRTSFSVLCCNFSHHDDAFKVSNISQVEGSVSIIDPWFIRGFKGGLQLDINRHGIRAKRFGEAQGAEPAWLMPRQLCYFFLDMILRRFAIGRH